MKPKKKKLLVILGGGAAALVLAVVVFALTFNLDSFKPRIEAAASRTAKLDVTINGRMKLFFFPFGISAKDIHVASKGGELISVEDLRLGVELMPLLKKQLKVTRCELVKPAVTVVKGADGKYNFESTEEKPIEGQPGAAFSLKDLKLSKGVLVYLDKKTGEKTELKNFNLEINDLLIPDTSENIVRNISFTGSFDCKEVRKGDLNFGNVKSPLKAEKGVIHLTGFTMDIFGSKGEGDATADESKVDAVYQINLKVLKLDFASLEESLGARKVIGGKGDLDASLTMNREGHRTLVSSMDGTLSLRGDNLVTYTMDLDEVLSHYETSQKFNLVDLGAFFIGGPLSTVAIKGYRYGDLYSQTQGGHGTITQFISHWKIKDGVADAADCALATHHNRVALKGKLDLVRERYEDNVIVALLDDKGCAKFKQSMSGPLGSPQVGAVSAIESLASPIGHLYRRVKRLLQGGKCEVFYSGAVKQPPEAPDLPKLKFQ
jgi:hypothetical protein